MPQSMPFELLIASSLMSLFVYEMQRAVRYHIYDGKMRLTVESIITLSLTAASVCGVYLFVKYWLATAWYWPVLLLLIKLITVPISSILIASVCGARLVALIALVGWPICAYWCLRIIDRLALY
jgi:hypothetical protein